YDNYDDYYTVCAGTARRAPYVPGAPSFRRAPAGGTVRPAPRPATGPVVGPPRTRKAAPESPRSPSPVRSRLTPGHN
ncbi:MAG: hypothetical protein ACYC2G_17770, partial [Gemmatimonadaceae bacterium]